MEKDGFPMQADVCRRYVVGSPANITTNDNVQVSREVAQCGMVAQGAHYGKWATLGIGVTLAVANGIAIALKV